MVFLYFKLCSSKKRYYLFVLCCNNRAFSVMTHCPNHCPVSANCMCCMSAVKARLFFGQVGAFLRKIVSARVRLPDVPCVSNGMRYIYHWVCSGIVVNRRRDSVAASKIPDPKKTHCIYVCLTPPPCHHRCVQINIPKKGEGKSDGGPLPGGVGGVALMFY